jgi:beta-glucuronidase
VTKLLRDGANQVTVGVDRRRPPSPVPPPVTDWENYGGVTRPIRLITTPDTYVDDAWVRLTRDGRITVSAHLDGPQAANSALRLRIGELKLELAEEPTRAWRLARHDGRTARWCAGRPKRPGFMTDHGGRGHLARPRELRTIETRGADILLNGKPVFLRGISVHEEEIGSNPARVITPDAARALLGEVKNGLHGNYVRLAHYPHSESDDTRGRRDGPARGARCRSTGWSRGSNPQTLATARNMLAEHPARSQPRLGGDPGVGNETPVTDAHVFLRTLVSDVRRWTIRGWSVQRCWSIARRMRPCRR